MKFDELNLCPEVMDGLDAMNFREATPVQAATIPVILNKKDLIACAQTGTGKTAAFILPLLHNLQTNPHPSDKVNAIIMAPTRELAQQIDQQMEGFSYFTPFSSVAVYGGNDSQAWDVQMKGLKQGADVVIATPGRLISHLNLYDIDFSQVKYFILDEADRMLDMGFFDDIMSIVKRLPQERQTILFSATMPPKIRTLAKNILQDPEEVQIAVSRPPDSIHQQAYICNESQKMGLIRELFQGKDAKKVIIFSGSRLKVKEISKYFLQMKLSVGEMHSDLDQQQRNHVMHEFKHERIGILVATDIVSRGIDIEDITMVLNYDVPHDAEDYVHRIGRTARASASGQSITFVSEDDQYRFYKIEQFLEKDIEKLEMPEGLGQAPEYNPEEHKHRHNKFAKKGKVHRERDGKSSRKPKTEGTETAGERTKADGRTEGERKPRNKRNPEGNKKQDVELNAVVQDSAVQGTKETIEKPLREQKPKSKGQQGISNIENKVEKAREKNPSQKPPGEPRFKVIKPVKTGNEVQNAPQSEVNKGSESKSSTKKGSQNKDSKSISSEKKDSTSKSPVNKTAASDNKKKSFWNIKSWFK